MRDTRPAGAGHRAGLAVLAMLVVVVMFVPARRYTLPSALPFHLEPYRVAIILAGAAVLLSLLLTGRPQVRTLGFGGILGALVVTSLVSVAANAKPITEGNLLGRLILPAEL